MMPSRTFWLLMAGFGTAIPWAYFGGFFIDHGPDPVAFVGGLFANGAAAGFTADVLISMLVFWLWSYHDARRGNIRHWWLTLPAGLTVGLSLALPLYLALREDPRKEREPA